LDKRLLEKSKAIKLKKILARMDLVSLAPIKPQLLNIRKVKLKNHRTYLDRWLGKTCQDYQNLRLLPPLSLGRRLMINPTNPKLIFLEPPPQISKRRRPPQPRNQRRQTAALLLLV
jgi:hypothetical protein